MVEQISSLKTCVKYKDTPVGKVPVDWKVASLGKIAHLEYGASLPDRKREKGEVPVYGSSGIAGFHSKALIDRPGIIVGRKGTVGSVNWADKNFWPIDTTYYISKKQSKEYLKWLFYFLSNHNFERLNITTGIPGLNREEAHSILVPVPPYPEQKKIADILTSMDKAIEKTIQVIEKAKELKKGLMQTLFTSGIGHKKSKKTILGKMPVEWEVKKLGQVSELKNGINFRKEQKGQRGILTIDVLNMYSSSIFIEPTSLYRVNINLMNKKDYILREGDILFVRSSVKKEGVGWACLFKPFNEQATFCGFLIRARLLKTNISPEFLTYFLRSDRVRGRLISGAGHAAITNISQNTLQDLDIVIPSFGEQKEIVKALSLIDDQIEKESNHLEQLKLLKKGLMQVLLTGKLRVTF